MLLQVAGAAATAAAANLNQNVSFQVPDDMTIFLTGIVSALAFLLIAMLVANLIKYEPGSNPRDPHKRRLWFWVLGALTLITTFVLLFFVFQPATTQDLVKMGALKMPSDRAAYDAKFMHYSKMYPIAVGVSFVLYVILGFVLSKIFKNKKIGNWF